MIKLAEEKNNREAARKYSVDETAASIYYFLLKLRLLIECDFYSRKYDIYRLP